MKENDEIIDWFIKNQSVYNILSKKIESILTELMEINKLSYYVISSRVKELKSFTKKIKVKNYDDPTKEITDLAGIRIITYVESQIKPIRNLIEATFKIDLVNSTDKSEELGIDKVGYKSVHYIAQLKPDRIKLPEYKRFKNLSFEIQIRTILQHAWAEIEHDRNYKFSGVLPIDIQRRFKLLAGLLETADGEFNAISESIDTISETVIDSTTKGNFKIPINSTTLKEYLPIKFKDLIGKGLDPVFLTGKREVSIINELISFGIDTLEKLDKIIPPDYIKNYEVFYSPSTYNNYNGLLTELMIIKDYTKYFNNVWSKDHWNYISLEMKNFLVKYYNFPWEEISEKYDIKIMPD